MINLSGEELIKKIMAKSVAMRAVDYLVADTDFLTDVTVYNEFGAIEGLVELFIQMECFTGDPEINIHDAADKDSYLTLQY